MVMATAILQGTWLSSFSAVRRKGSVSYMMTCRLLSVQSEPSFSLMGDPRVTIATAAFGRVDCYYTDLNVSSGLIIDLRRGQSETLKAVVQSKMEILSRFAHPHVIPSL